MAIYKFKSLEHYVTCCIGTLSGLIIVLTAILLWQLQWRLWHIVAVILLESLALYSVAILVRGRVIAGFERALLHIEAIRLEDYNLISKPAFAAGTVGVFHQELAGLSQYLAENKTRYDKHVFLVYQLIDQLNTPVLVFDKNDRLSYANSAFSVLFDQPWQVYRNVSPGRLGLIQRQGRWLFERDKRSWEVRHSRFSETDEVHQLMIFVNIEPALSETQMSAWQQIIRVIAHEINNSLTPVSSLAESLAVRTQSERDQTALELISQRCKHLQDFINRYSSLSKQLELQSVRISTSQLLQRLDGLFAGLTLSVQVDLDWIWGDSAFLEQVLINLIKNAWEAKADRVDLHVYEKKGAACIEVTDNGHGFSNTDNAFVPLFTTKQNGHGIGLSFCRNIIQQHRGTIRLSNNADQGVNVLIALPLPVPISVSNSDRSRP